MYKKTPLVILMFLVVFTLFSQNETTTYNPNQTATDTVVQQVVYTLTEPEFKKYWSFGGNIGLSFWNGGADILVGPKAYYNISPKFLTGFGLAIVLASASTFVSCADKNPLIRNRKLVRNAAANKLLFDLYIFSFILIIF
mgnify:CR=1 FL=1